jgi:hypothetical protein
MEIQASALGSAKRTRGWNSEGYFEDVLKRDADRSPSTAIRWLEKLRSSYAPQTWPWLHR